MHRRRGVRGKGPTPSIAHQHQHARPPALHNPALLACTKRTPTNTYPRPLAMHTPAPLVSLGPISPHLPVFCRYLSYPHSTLVSPTPDHHYHHHTTHTYAHTHIRTHIRTCAHTHAHRTPHTNHPLPCPALPSSCAATPRRPRARHALTIPCPPLPSPAPAQPRHDAHEHGKSAMPVYTVRDFLGGGTRPEPFNSSLMGAGSVWFGSVSVPPVHLHARCTPMGVALYV